MYTGVHCTYSVSDIHSGNAIHPPSLMGCGMRGVVWCISSTWSRLVCESDIKYMKYNTYLGLSVFKFSNHWSIVEIFLEISIFRNEVEDYTIPNIHGCTTRTKRDRLASGF